MRPSITNSGAVWLALLALAGCGEQEAAKPAAAPPPAERGAPAPATPSAASPAQGPAAVETPAVGSAPVAASAPAATATPATAAPTSSAAVTAASASGTLLRDSELKEGPFLDAKTLATLPAQGKVTVRERDGGWFHVDSQGKSGWVRMLNVKVTEGAERLSSGGQLAQASTLATGRAGSGNVVSTSGLRGLSEEELSAAQPDYAQFDKLNSYAVDKSAANSFAKGSGLSRRTLPYLPAPKK